jgi:hypothetical protein
MLSAFSRKARLAKGCHHHQSHHYHLQQLMKSGDADAGHGGGFSASRGCNKRTQLNVASNITAARIVSDRQYSTRNTRGAVAG